MGCGKCGNLDLPYRSKLSREGFSKSFFHTLQRKFSIIYGWLASDVVSALPGDRSMSSELAPQGKGGLGDLQTTATVNIHTHYV